MSKQAFFDFGLSENAESHFIVSLCNIDAYNLIHNTENFTIAIIIGEEGSGKTTLLNTWAQEHNAQKLCIQEISDISSYQMASVIVLDNFDMLKDEETFFYFLNHCISNKVKLLMSATALPQYKKEDLNSRINAAFKAFIRPPDEDLMKLLLKKYFALEQTKVSEETIEFLVRRIDSKFSALWKVCESLNVESFQAMRPITHRIVSKVLNK